MKRVIINGRATLVDDVGIPLTRVDSLGDHDSDDEVASVDNDMTNFLASKDVGYGTNSLLEQWKKSYGNGEYDYDPYENDMYEGQDIPAKIQDISDNLDMRFISFGLCGVCFLHGVIMNRGFLDSGGRKSNHRKKMDTVIGIGSTLESVETSINVIPLVDFVEKEVLSPFVVDETVAKEKQRSLVNTTGLGSFPPLPSQENLSTGNAPRKSSNANVTGKSSGKNVNFRTLFTPGVMGLMWLSRWNLLELLVNEFLILYMVSSWERGWPTLFLLTMLGTLGVNMRWFDLCSAHLLDYFPFNLVLRMVRMQCLKMALGLFAKEGYYTRNICVEYEWKPPRKWDLNQQNNKSYQPVSKKSIANNRGDKNKNVEPTNKVSKSNSFDTLNSVDNDVELGTNRGSTHFSSQEANSSSSTFWNVESSSPSTTTPIIEKINKMENLFIDGKAILVDNEGKPLSKVDDESEDEVASVDNEMAGFLAKEDGYGTQNLLEQWKDSRELDEYEYDPYDNDLYEG
ncbi:hypothetical protein Tco_0292144 [Tanacetum coccineum]